MRCTEELALASASLPPSSSLLILRSGSFPRNLGAQPRVETLRNSQDAELLQYLAAMACTAAARFATDSHHTDV